MSFKFSNQWLVAAIALTGTLAAQQIPLDRSSLKIDLPADSPIMLVSADFGQSRASARGGAMVLDLNLSLTLLNNSAARVRGITMVATAQEVTPGGKASVAVPSLDIGPGEKFPLRVDLHLLRPLQPGMAGPLVQVGLDGVLFQDFQFYGPNRLDSRRSMTAWEAEAQRDRQHFKAVLHAYGQQGLQRAMLDSLERQASRPRLDVQVARGRRTTSGAAQEQMLQFAFLDFPNSPVQPLSGSAQVASDVAQGPRIQVRNRSTKPVRYYEIGWIVKDSAGKEYWAASVPASRPGAMLDPGQTASALQDATLRFAEGPGKPVAVQGMTGFVSQVEFSDGQIWVPDRDSLSGAHLLRLMAPSPEEQRLSDMYRKKGLNAVVDELKKF